MAMLCNTLVYSKMKSETNGFHCSYSDVLLILGKQLVRSCEVSINLQDLALRDISLKIWSSAFSSPQISSSSDAVRWACYAWGPDVSSQSLYKCTYFLQRCSSLSLTTANQSCCGCQLIHLQQRRYRTSNWYSLGFCPWRRELKLVQFIWIAQFMVSELVRHLPAASLNLSWEWRSGCCFASSISWFLYQSLLSDGAWVSDWLCGPAHNLCSKKRWTCWCSMTTHQYRIFVDPIQSTEKLCRLGGVWTPPLQASVSILIFLLEVWFPCVIGFISAVLCVSLWSRFFPNVPASSVTATKNCLMWLSFNESIQKYWCFCDASFLRTSSGKKKKLWGISVTILPDDLSHSNPEVPWLFQFLGELPFSSEYETKIWMLGVLESSGLDDASWSISMNHPMLDFWYLYISLLIGVVYWIQCTRPLQRDDGNCFMSKT